MKGISCAPLAALLSLWLVGSATADDSTPIADILQGYVDDFRTDVTAKGPLVFGVRVSGEGGGDWHVVVGDKAANGEVDVSLRPGLPEEPTFFFTTDVVTLRKVAAGELNALTAMAKEWSTDFAPFDIDAMPGFQPDGAFVALVVPLSFHFWTRGFPERVPFGEGLTRESHGANVTIFYYQPGLRSAWVMIQKGEHVNKEARSQTNPFPSMLIGLKGKCDAKIGGKQTALGGGEMMFIPAKVTHEFWNDRDAAFEGILLMFGEGA